MNENSFVEGLLVGQNGNNGLGGNDGGLLWIIIILALLGGFGNNGFGNGGGNNMLNYELGRTATTNDVASGFNNSAVLSRLGDLQAGQSGIEHTLCQGFNGINTAVLQQGNAMERGFAQLAYDNQACCCQTQRAIDGVNYNIERSTCDLKNTIFNSTRDILDAFTNMRLEAKDEKIACQDREILSLKYSNALRDQSTYLLNQIMPIAKPSYPACSPWQTAFGNAQVGYSYNNNNNCCNDCFR